MVSDDGASLRGLSFASNSFGRAAHDATAGDSHRPPFKTGSWFVPTALVHGGGKNGPLAYQAAPHGVAAQHSTSTMRQLRCHATVAGQARAALKAANAAECGGVVLYICTVQGMNKELAWTSFATS